MSRFLVGNIKGPKGDRGETGAVGPKGEQGIQGPVGPAGGVNSVNGKTGDVNIADALGYTPADQEDVLLKGEVDGRNLIEVSDLSFFNINGTIFSTNNIIVNTASTTADSLLLINKTFKKGTYIININGDILYFLLSIKLPGFEENNFYKAKGVPYFGAVTFPYTFTASEDFKIGLVIKEAPQILTGLKMELGDISTQWTPAPEDVVTKTPYDIFTALDGIPEMHRNLYRGRNLGESTAMSEAHKKAIQDGSFKDLFVGDYWTHNNVNWRIADADYFYNCGDKAFTTHHLVIVPDMGLYTAAMNSSNTTDGGYVNSEMRTKNLTQAREMAEEAFPGMVLSHRDVFCNNVKNGKPSNGGWEDSILELMNEIMMFGGYAFTPKNDGTGTVYLYTTGNSQLSLFRLNPKFIKLRQTYWLRDVVSADGFANVDGNGFASHYYASNSYSVRPYICIGVQAAGDEAEDDMGVVPSVGNPERMEADEMDDSDLDMSTMGDPLDTTY